MKKESNKQFYKRFCALYIMLVLQNVVTLSVNLLDNMMIGSYSEIALSGVAAVNQIQFVYQQLLMALGDGLVIFCSQYWGKRQTEPMKKIAASAMQIGVLFATVLFLLMSVFPHKVVGIFTPDQGIIQQGVEYLSIVRFTFLFFAVTQILLATLRSVEIVRIALYLSFISLATNGGINWLLIYGNLGAPEMGVAGAAVGTLVARGV